MEQGEYTTGITPSGQSKSDKKIGVVGVTMFDLRRRGKVSELVHIFELHGLPRELIR